MKTNKQHQRQYSVSQSRSQTQSRIADLARTVLSIDAQQSVSPGYCLSISRSIVRAELKRLWEESYGREVGPSGRM